MNKKFILLLCCVFLLALLVWRLRPLEFGASSPAVTPRVQLELRDVVLYFTNAEGVSLVSEERRIAGCNEERQCVAQTIEALAKSSGLLLAVLPERTRVLDVEIEGDLARINFSRDLVNRHPGGSVSELLTVYGLTNTLAVNFPAIHRLQILVEGEVLPTLKGHADISRPVRAEFRYSYIPGSDEGETSPDSQGTIEAGRPLE